MCDDPTENPSQAEFQDLPDQLRQALRGWSKKGQEPSPLKGLFLFQQALRSGTLSERQATNQLLLAAIEALRIRDAESADILQLRYLDGKSVRHVARHFNLAESTIYGTQRDALQLLTEVAVERERAAVAQQQSLLYQRLEAATYTQLFGADASFRQLRQRLGTPGPPWLLSIEGIGGIGKTSLADMLLRQLIADGSYYEVGWVSARQQKLTFGGTITLHPQPALTAEGLIEQLYGQLFGAAGQEALSLAEMLSALRVRLQQTPHLIVVDNLETVDDVEALLPTLHDLADPSKFVITSRHHHTAGTNIYRFVVPGLDQEQTFALIRYEAEQSNLPTLASSREDVLAPIYEAVGGNPLALRLVVGQVHLYPLGTILDNLKRHQGEAVSNLYTYIYWQAWQSLSHLERSVLLSMPMVDPEGDDVPYLTEVAALPEDEVRMGLNRLVTLNLVDARGGLEERLYSIHGLTRTFLHENFGDGPPFNA